MKVERDPDQLFSVFLQKWAKERGCTFHIDTFDGREADDLIDGMAVDDVWGWLTPIGQKEHSEAEYGCVIWEKENERLVLRWMPQTDIM